MAKTLIRGNDVPADSETLSTSEFLEVALEQISNTAQSIKGSVDAEPILEGMSDILELMCEYLKAKNIQPEYLFEYVNEIRNTKGTFAQKVAVLKD